LAGLVALLGAAMWAELVREERARPQPLTHVDAGAATRIAVTCRTACANRVFERAADGWRMTEPYALPASDEAIARLVAIAQAPVRKRRAAREFDAAKIGLDPPVASIRLGELAIDVGTTDAINHLRYVRHGDDIALVPDRAAAWLFAPAESELDRHLAPRGVALATVRIDGEERPALTAAWQAVTTSQVVASNTVPVETATPRRVELVAVGGATIRYALSRADGRYVAVRDDLPLAYPLDEAQMQQLLPSP
ncbi:MAG TPA: DUF4340 domain-containing protein, partial [Tahibacter sp.]|nr:DUF4340 domain-containing protein [Tahibacter sp.]